MKKILGLLAATAISASAFSITYTDVQETNTYVGWWGSTSGWFDIVNPGSDSAFGYTDLGGYSTGTTIDSASATFWFGDDSSSSWDGDEYTIVTVGLLPNGVQQLPSGSSTTINVGVNALEIAFIEAAGGINWSVSSAYGDFNLLGAMLQAEVDDLNGSGNSIPDSGSVLVLLGLGLSGLGLARRMMRK